MAPILEPRLRPRPGKHHQLLPLRELGLAHREHLLLLGHRLGARLVGRGLRLGLRPRLLGDRDRALLLAQLDGLSTADFQFLDAALTVNAFLLDRPLGGDARAVHRLARLDLRSLGLLLARRLLRATSARWAARFTSSSRSCCRRAYSSSRSMSSAWRSVSRFLLRIWIIVSCSMSFRFFLRVSIVSVSRVRPSASNAFDG